MCYLLSELLSYSARHTPYSNEVYFKATSTRTPHSGMRTFIPRTLYPDLPPEVIRTPSFISSQSAISPYKTDLFVEDLSAVCLSFTCELVFRSNRPSFKISKHDMTAILIESSPNGGETLGWIE